MASKASGDSMNIAKLVGSSWYKILEPQFSQEYFGKLWTKVSELRRKETVFPAEEDVFSWTKYCAFEEVKVVILGQDPYPGPGFAHGLSFSVSRSVEKVPQSLANIFKELESDVIGFKRPSHGYLEGWAMQGVLLLNTVLTVTQGKPNSHSARSFGWQTFTDAVLHELNERRNGLVFLLWGNNAEKKGELINKDKHVVLTAPHPSPQSAHKGFFGCKHFSEANKYLTKNKKSPIDWNDLP